MNNMIELFKQLLGIAVVLAVLYYIFDIVTKDENDKPGTNDKND